MFSFKTRFVTLKIIKLPISNYALMGIADIKNLVQWANVATYTVEECKSFRAFEQEIQTKLLETSESAKIVICS